MAATQLIPLLLLLLGGHVGPRLSLPPLPEDPTLARMAPENPLWYFSWSGTIGPDPKSGNQTEQILAETEVRDFLHAIDKALSDAIQTGAPFTPQGKLLGSEGPKLIRALIAHPAAAFISKVAVGKRGTEVSGGIVVGTGAETEELKGILERLEQTVLGATKPAASVAAATWHKITASANLPAIEWGFRGKYLIVAFGDQSAEENWNRRDGQPPDWLTTIKKKLSVERVATVHYIDVTKVFEELSPPIMTVHDRNVLDGFDVENIEQFADVSGLEGAGYVSKTWIRTHGSPERFWAILGPKPLTAADLAPIPKDASIALAARVQPSRMFEKFVDCLTAIDRESGRQLAAQIKDSEAELKLRFKEDFLDTLGDTCCIYNSPNDGGLLVTGLTIVVPVTNHDRLVKTNERIVKRLREAAGPKVDSLRPLTLNESTFKQQVIYALAQEDVELPGVRLAWCITGKQLIISLSPQNIRAFLSRDQAVGSLADVPAVAERLKSNSPVLLGYEDTAGMLKITYPLLQIFVTAECKEFKSEGLDFDPGVVPSLGSLIRHVDPAISTLTGEKDGLLIVTRQSLPIDLTLSEIVAIIALEPDLVLPAF